MYTYTLCVLAEPRPLRKTMLCHVDKALNSSLQCLSSAKTAYKLFVISRKEIKGKKKKEKASIHVLYKLYKYFVLHPPPEREIARDKVQSRQLGGLGFR